MQIDLGHWQSFVHPEMLSWYRLPNDSIQECKSYRANGKEMTPLSHEEYAAFHKRLVTYVRKSVAPFQPAYHNDQMHFASVEADGLQAADAYALPQPARMPLAVRQMFGASLRTHDAHHCASTFRFQAPHSVYRPKLGLGVSSEWVTAEANNRFLKKEGWSFPARMFQVYVVWSSTYGGNTPHGKRLGIPSPQPTTPWGTIMRAADVCPPRNFEVWLQRTIAVNYGEVPATPPASTWAEWIVREHGFADYIQYTFDRMDASAGFELARRVGWHRRLREQQNWVEALGNTRSPVRRFAEHTLATYGVRLG